MEYVSKHLDHHGIVAAACDAIGIVEEIDKAIPPDPRQKLTVGEAIKAMIINGLGFTTRPLSLTPQFFQSKPVELLIKPGITADTINDDVLGRALDAVFEFGCTTLFSRIAMRAVKKFQVDIKYQHLDTTVMQVEGEYGKQLEITPWSGHEGQSLISFGRPKDGDQSHRQFLISMLTSSDGGIPILCETLAGNTSDQKHFKQVLKKLKKEIKDCQEDIYHIADSALYCEPNIVELADSDIKFITHVPSKIKETERIKLAIDKSMMTDFGNGYHGYELCSIYGKVPQRWLVIESEKAFYREYQILQKVIRKEMEELPKALRKIRAQAFSCEKDALKAIQKEISKSDFHKLHSYSIEAKAKKEGKGRPKKSEVIEEEYYISTSVKLSKNKIRTAKKLKGRFVLATNELDENKLSSADILSHYKDQQVVERGFRFLKDPVCMTDAVFLKKTTRIVALGMLMCLCLLVYAIAQRHLRQALIQAKETLPNQIKKQIQTPTLKWIFQIFEGIDVLYQKFNNPGRIMILNLDDLRVKILTLLGFHYQKIYLLVN
jgi:transposase